MPLIKSHSNYVLKKKHQLINDGTIFERDITTIGAVNQFAPGQKAIYRSGNFIITVRDDRGQMIQYNTNKWEKNNDTENWTLDNIVDMVSTDVDQNDTRIVLKNDYYDFREFAYYGSLTELFRASMNDILARFPGELFCLVGSEGGTDSEGNNIPEMGTVYYTESHTEDFVKIEEKKRLGGEGYYYVSNPYGINIHSEYAPSDANPLKFFANEGYKNYETIVGDEDEGSQIVDWVVIPGKCDCTALCIDGECPPIDDCYTVGELFAKIKITTADGREYIIYAYLGDNEEVIYLHTSDTNGFHIRPIGKVINTFYNESNDFEKIILNPNTSPKYKAIFSVIGQDDFGYTRTFEEFIFPTSQGGYNLSVNSAYTDRLVEIGEFYDEYLTDNLYRSMTHESIKNFDWTQSREYEEDDIEDYRIGGDRIKKALRVFAREFDEIKKYIDNIRYVGRITYDERNNLPDYFLADTCEDDGWDIKSIIPYTLTNEWGKDVSPITEQAILENTNNKFNHKYTQDPMGDTLFTPYSPNNIWDGSEDGYFIVCDDCDCTGLVVGDPIGGCLGNFYGDNVITAGDLKTITMFPSNRIEYVIKPYTSTTEVYTLHDTNNEFLRRLKLNSRYIWRHKGTIEGIEMMLGMFGLKSRRWLEKNKKCGYQLLENADCHCIGEDAEHKPCCCDDGACLNCKSNDAALIKDGKRIPDFDIIEYTQFTSPIEDEWDATHQMYHIDWINTTKTIAYDYRSTSNYSLPSNMGGVYAPYQGLPVAYYDKGGKRYLYPKFEKYEEIDGNPYFQMDGGWLSKTLNNQQNFQFDADDNIVHTQVKPGGVDSNGFIIDNPKLYKETVRSIKRFDTLSELLSVPQEDLYDGIICYVGKIEDELAIVNGKVYTVEYDEDNNKYITLTLSEGYIKIGGLFFSESIIVYNVNGEEAIHYLSDKLDGYEVMAYIKSDGSFVCKDGNNENYAISSFKLIKNTDKASYSNYFKLDDVVFSDSVTYNTTGNGWRRLQYKERDYLKINTIYNYYEGNNPHDGLMRYDSGHEYFTYFQRLFKYAEDNNLFDTRCYAAESGDILYDVLNPNDTPIGFAGLINPIESVKEYGKYLSADTKVHYFGNYKVRKGGTGSDKNNIDKIYIYGKSDEYDNCKCTKQSVETKTYDPWKCFYGGKEPNYYQITSNAASGVKIDGEKQPHTSTDPVTNQIVNNKRIKIKFNMKYGFKTKEGQEELKYIDDIVMNYLTQMIPSTVITDIEYNFCDFNYEGC